MFDLTGKLAIVTGGGQGIGEGIALGLAECGANVVVAARTAEKVAAVAAKIKALGRESLGVVTDVTDEASVQNLVNETKRALGGVDILVNNAGGTSGTKFRRVAVMEFTSQEFDECIALNLKSTFYACRAVVPLMLERGAGSIINVGSIAGRLNEPPQIGSAVYGAAKAGIVAFTRCLAMELAPRIRVNCVVPGPVNNPQSRNRSAEAQRALEGGSAMGRAGEPEDIAGAVVYFASAASGWTTGASLDVDGGLRSLRPPSSANRGAAQAKPAA